MLARTQFMPPAAADCDLPSLLERYERPLVRYACSILGDLDDARDVVQETFIRFARDERPELQDNPRHLEAWLFTVCRNRALDHQRKYARIIPMPLTEHDPVAHEPTPAAALEQRDTAASLLRLLDALTPNQREVIRLKFQNDLSYKEIAEVTQLSVTNVGFLLHTGLKKLRALMQDQPCGDAWAAPAAARPA
jgi:RNA polymerase sigma factor (sigma-70 family)